MSKLNVAICDDDEVFVMHLEKMIREINYKYSWEMNIESFTKGQDFLHKIQSGALYTLVFLDINIPSVSGIDICEILRNKIFDYSTEIVFVSSEVGYALELFRFQPFDFLIKPLGVGAIEKVLRLFIRQKAKAQEFLTVSLGRESIRLPVDDIIYCMSKGKKVEIFTLRNTHYCYLKMNAISQELDEEKFMRIHKSFLVNVRHIAKCQYEFLVMSNGAKLSISQARRPIIREKLLWLSVNNSEVKRDG